MNILNEEWRDVSGYEGYYQVSNLGRVRSCDRIVKLPRGDRMLRGRILKPALNSHGYLVFSLYRYGKPFQFTAHRLVAIAFLAADCTRDQVNHKNGVKVDNYVENLEWCTSSDNIRHAYAVGLKSHKGENHPRSILCEEQVLAIRRLRSKGLTQKVIGEMYGVSESAIRGIVNLKTWKHI